MALYQLSYEPFVGRDPIAAHGLWEPLLSKGQRVRPREGGLPVALPRAPRNGPAISARKSAHPSGPPGITRQRQLTPHPASTGLVGGASRPAAGDDPPPRVDCVMRPARPRGLRAASVQGCSPRRPRSFSPSLSSARRSIMRTASSLLPPMRLPASRSCRPSKKTREMAFRWSGESSPRDSLSSSKLSSRWTTS